MKTLLITTFSFIVILTSFSISETYIPAGYISGTWTTAGSPYRILGDITIHADSMLTIEPGVEVIFQGLYSLQVNGALAAIGAEIDSISFYAADTSVGWRGIRLAAGADSSRISYASIRYGRNTDGGGIYCASPKAEITHCFITKNIASNKGGGICIDNGNIPPPLINNCVITGNSARFGGGLYYQAWAMNISDCVISFNSASDVSEEANGGGLYLDGFFGSSIQISNCMIENNSCESDPSGSYLYGLGGGIFIHQRNNGGILISNCEILSNWSRRSGGGIFLDQSGVVISDCTIRGNFTKLCGEGGRPTLGGGAICFDVMSSASLISRCEISENSGMGYSGGAIRVRDASADLTLENCTLSGNYSWIGVGAIYFPGNLYLKNSIIAFTQSESHVGALGAGNAAVSYCDFFRNDGPHIIVGALGGFGSLTTTNANGDSCDVYSNIFLDPLFADTSMSDFHLTENSPCIDAGDPASPLDPDSTIADMGAFFFDHLFPIIYINEDSLNFGTVEIRAQKDTTFKIFNQGLDTLFINNITSSLSVFTTDFNVVNNFILPADSMLITVTFTPIDSGFVDDTLVIDNNAQATNIYLSGNGKIPVGLVDDELIIPKEYALYPAYPNPFNPTSTIKFDLPKAGKVELTLYDALGREIAKLVDKHFSAGRYKIEWNAQNYASGIYYYKLTSGSFYQVKKMILLK